MALDILAWYKAAALVVNLEETRPGPVRAFGKVAGFFSQIVTDSFNRDLGDDPAQVRALAATLMARIRAMRPSVNRKLFGNTESVILAARAVRKFAAEPQHPGAIFHQAYRLLLLAYNNTRTDNGDTGADQELSNIMYRLQCIIDPISPAQETPDDWD